MSRQNPFADAFSGQPFFTPIPESESETAQNTAQNARPPAPRSSSSVFQDSAPSSPIASPVPSRRGSFAFPMSNGPSRRSSFASGNLPIRPKIDYSGPNTPSLLSRAGSPTQPLQNQQTRSRSSSFVGGATLGGLGAFAREKKEGEFVGSVDCGTTSTRFIVFDSHANIVCEHQTEFEQILPHAGWHEQEPEHVIDSVKECVRQAVEKLEFMGWKASSIKAIGITNQRETTLCWSKKTGKPLCNALVWDDTRTVTLVRHYEKLLEEVGIEVDEDEEEVAEKLGAAPTAAAGELHGTEANGAAFGSKGDVVVEGGIVAKSLAALNIAGADGKRFRKGKESLIDITGIPLSTYFSAIKLRWMIDHHPEVKEADDSEDLAFGTVDSWIVYNLTGKANGGLHIIDVTNASRTLLLSLRTLAWHPPLLRFFGINPACLPRVVSSAENYGPVAEGIDLPIAGCPIAGIVGDQQAALVGNKCLRKGEAKNTYGTGAFVLFNTGEEVVRSQNGLISTVAYQAGKDAKPVYALEGSIAVAGSAIKWLRDQLNLIEESADMDILGGSVKDTGGVYFVTAFSGLLAPYWDRDASGMIIGMTSYTTSAHIARATLEAVCFQTRAVLDVIEKESGVKLEELKVDGGVTNSDLAMQLQADIGGFKVCRPSMRESTALGSALLAGHALGLFGWNLSEPSTLAEVNIAGTTLFEPELEEKKRQSMLRGWAKAVERAKKWHEIEEEDEQEKEWEEQI